MFTVKSEADFAWKGSHKQKNKSRSEQVALSSLTETGS